MEFMIKINWFGKVILYFLGVIFILNGIIQWSESEYVIVIDLFVALVVGLFFMFPMITHKEEIKQKQNKRDKHGKVLA